ncbi:hypothetical protein HWD03_gp116 [Alteromonas phage vB_AmeM_PT11-V22]|uniref:Uncharacterized protein n=1 Tax=Alteromonas phage vB_AmeM_PT11-V22 TaxID=2704031 RepID=A0A6C0R1Z2_9CAUD|nr:hypothetical protein HWD03_gp116 [Alteromonas phage vB_AmeM_PT11-V22]QHZ59847.1 hypothetical protein [Alteromonas phage vB_AmeM_PT11-V22]
MATILDIHMYKQEILNHIKKVFPNAEEYSNGVESWVEVIHNNIKYGTSYPNSLEPYLEHGMESHVLANTMLDRLTREIVKGEDIND